MNTPSFTSWFQTETLWGLSLVSIALAVAAALGAYLAMSLLLGVAVNRARRLAEGGNHRTAGVVYELLAGTSRLLVLVAAVLVGVSLLDLPGRWATRVAQLWFLALALQVGLWGTRAVGLGIARYRAQHGVAAAGDAAPFSASATLLSWGLRTLLWTTVLLAMLSNLGVNITAFVASLGVGGIAVALAVQNILGDLFASLAIAVDKPFDAGDFIVVGSVAGTVQRIGLKTTRIRSLSGEQVVMSNTDLLKQTINNYRYMQERRIVFQFSVPYGTTAEQAEAIPQAARRIIEAEDKARFDRAHLQGFGENGLKYEVVYIVLDPGYNLYMDLQQRINLSLMRELAVLGVEFAVPARTLHWAVPGGGQPPGGFLQVQQPVTA
ncbi:mechanosensitive ion channel family protein [Paracidovorax valerianellae]|uniref:Small-conductance mechanosensitive channel n=1 Tax=Paracidovorax valerianellae TaxID=187868 RepID=A0A1G6S6G9_9BURK|nr:mechanosensitive ion channel family protein [Paracidovorax valerianellae]MDA8444204.1 mechanosensitive ion channel family protein [Paracidovorax valerianellae]SDD12429.1 Small-conductance mechanosensitive channel [Paracidovorax valerianellae]